MKFSRHSLKRMSERGITEDDVRAALNRPVGNPEPANRGNIMITGLAMNRKLLCVVCYEEPDETLIISVYWSNVRER